MYARYVPAASKKADSGAPPAPRFGLPTSTYVPRPASPVHPPRGLSPASKRKHDESFNNGASPAPRPKKSKSGGSDSDSDSHGDQKKTKSKKKSKKAASDSDSTSDSSSDSSSDNDSSSEEEDEENAAALKKEKKEKRDKPKKKKVAVEESEDDDEADRRHATIMAKKSKALQTAAAVEEDPMDVDEPSDLEMHGLEPLPQPEPVAIDTSKPTYETLPSWLAAPIRVAPDTRTPFADIGISEKVGKALEAKGFKDAFAVQTAAIPMLLPTSKTRQGDLLVAAATGSGKTLAYALPIVRDISGGQVTRLRALIVLPTRELVVQAQEVFQMCAAAFDGKDAKKVRIGISIGSQQLRQDQAALVEEIQRYDPRAYKQALRRFRGPWSYVEDSDSDPDDEKIHPRPVASHLPDHVVDHKSRVDVLICTPGRLVDHINQTPGFSLDYVRWLVVDEADRLLAQSFQGWLDVVMPLLSTKKFSARDHPGSNLSGVRKVILSATLTRDLSLLGGLQLRFPQLIVLEGAKGDGKAAQTAEHTLPSQLEEAAVRVYNTTLKPLYLLELLQGDHLLAPAGSAPAAVEGKKKVEEEDTSSEEDSDTSSDESESDTSSSSEDSDAAPKKTKAKAPTGAFSKTVLIFTKSNEAALRLSRLLALVSPPLASLIGTLTSTQKTSHRRRVLSSFASGSLRILVASDLVARGIDLPALDNVINYDLPASAAGYVHRVGRTARAGRPGRAVTLVETRESGWFWGAVGKWAGIRRHAEVARVRVGDREAEHVGFDAERVKAYEEALAELGREAGEKKHK